MTDSSKYPSISVVIPSLNQGQYIEETIVSILGQEYPNLEILILDAGSTDNTVEVIKRYESKISYWHSKKDNGQADAINLGMSMSSGDILCWLNSDDMYIPGTLLDIGRRLCGKTSNNYLIYGPTITIEQSHELVYCSAQNATPFDSSTLTHHDIISQPSAFWTRNLWQSVGELNTSYNFTFDWDWFIRASRVVEFEYVPKCYSLYRYHPLHKSSNSGSKRRNEIIDVVKEYSSDYWVDLYTTVDKYYDRIKNKLEFLKSLRVPKRHFLIPFIFPELGMKIKDISHLFSVMDMLHFPNSC